MARFQDVLAALKQLRDTEKTKYGIMEKTGQNQTDMVKGLTDQMGQLGDMAFSKHMTEGKDARASAEAAAQRKWQGDLTTSEGKADRKNALDIANIPKEKNYKPSDPKDMWDNVTIGMILSDVGTSLGILPITNDFGIANPDYGKILSDSRSKDQAYDAIDSLILKGKLPEGSEKLYRKMVDRFFEQQGQGGSGNGAAVVPPVAEPKTDPVREAAADNFMDPARNNMWGTLKQLYQSDPGNQLPRIADSLTREAKDRLEKNIINIDGYNRIIAQIKSLSSNEVETSNSSYVPPAPSVETIRGRKN